MNSDVLNTHVNTYNIDISDNDVLSMDEATGNITVNRNILADCKPADIVVIHFTEDSDNISHRYVVDSVDDSHVLLNWEEQLGEILTEDGLFDKIRKAVAPTDGERIDRQLAKSAKVDEKIKKAVLKLILKEIGPEGKNWKFFIQNPDGTHAKKPLTQKQFIDLFVNKHNKELTPDVANALVADQHDVFLRRGMEDVSKQHIFMKPNNTKILPKYEMPRPDQTNAQQSSETQDGSTEQSQETTETTTETNSNDNSSSDNSSEQPAQTETSSEEQEQPQRTRSSSRITAKALQKALNIARVTGMVILDSEGKSVDLSSPLDINKITVKTIGNYTVKIGNKRGTLSDWIKGARKVGVLSEGKKLTESPVITLSDEDMFNPQDLSIRDKIKKAEEDEARAAHDAMISAEEDRYKRKFQNVLHVLPSIHPDSENIQDHISWLHRKLVPSSGVCPTVGGELIRAMMRILYRDYNDGDKFFTGYGIETCGSSAQYLYDNGLDTQIDAILEDVYQLADDDTEYTSVIKLLACDVVNHIRENADLIFTLNDTDSRDYPTDYIEEKQPRYEFEIQPSNDIIELINRSIVSPWDLNSYVEDQLSYESVYADAEVCRPWSNSDVTVTVENLTSEAYERLSDTVKDPELFWESFVSDYVDELNTDNEEDSE